MGSVISPKLDGAERSSQVVRLRADLRAGVPDMNSPEAIAEARRQSKLIADSPQEAEDQAFVDSISIGFDEVD